MKAEKELLQAIGQTLENANTDTLRQILRVARSSERLPTAMPTVSLSECRRAPRIAKPVTTSWGVRLISGQTYRAPAVEVLHELLSHKRRRLHGFLYSVAARELEYYLRGRDYMVDCSVHVDPKDSRRGARFDGHLRRDNNVSNPFENYVTQPLQAPEVYRRAEQMEEDNGNIGRPIFVTVAFSRPAVEAIRRINGRLFTWVARQGQPHIAGVEL